MKTFYLQVITGRRGGLLAVLLRFALSCLSVGYAVALGIRRALYAAGILRAARLSCPVISVGNLSVGGTGKTPMCEFLARWLAERGVRVAILSRGYGKIDEIRDDEEPSALPRNVRRLAHPNRARLARQVIQDFKPDAILLDDGFQHYRIRRDLDIVLVDALNPFSNGRLIPRGLLRETASACRRADILVLTRADQVDPTRLETLRALLERHAPGRPILEASHRPVELFSLTENRRFTLEWLRGRDVLAFGGIGNPEAFRLTAESLGAALVSFVAFPDHHAYGPEDAKLLNVRAKEFMAEALLTTEKDASKLRAGDFETHLLALRVEMKILRGGEVLEPRLRALTGLARPEPARTLTGPER